MPSKGGGKGGGKGHRRGKNNGSGDKHELRCKAEGEEYMQILKMWGNGRCCGYGVDGVMRMCVIRGNMRKKVWIQPGDYVLVSVPEYQKEKCFIVNKYSPDEVRTLRSMSEIPESFKGVTGRETFEDKLADELLDNIHFADDEDRSDSEDTVDIAEV